VKVPGGFPNTNYVWKLDLDQFAGLTYEINANGKGVEAPNNGFSVPLSGNTLKEDYPIYLSYPNLVLPEPTASVIDITGVSFLDVANADNTISPSVTIGTQDTGNFRFSSNVLGNYSIAIDTNNDGQFKAGDVFLFGTANVGSNIVPWNGRGANGNVLPVGTYNVQIQVRVGEYHFVSGDGETSGGGGLTIYRATGGTGVADTTVFWDDITKLPGAGGTSNLPLGGLSSTPQGKHAWGNFTAAGFGDQKFVDTYTYGKAATVITQAIIAIDDSAKFSISGKVYNDVNYNSENNTEAGIGGIKVSFFADANSDGIPDGAAISIQTTDANGNYTFPPVINGNYLVQEVDSANWISTTTNSLKVVISNANQVNQDFGDYQQTANLCPSTTFLNFYNRGNTGISSTQLYTLDLATGVKSIIPTSTGISTTLDSLGFNKLDGFLYGLDDTNTLYRISQTGVPVSIGTIPGLVSPIGGEIDTKGYFYSSNFNSNVIDVIDLNPARSSFKTKVGSFSVTGLPSFRDSDISISPIDGQLYIVGQVSGVNRGYKFTPPANFTTAVAATPYAISGTGLSSAVANARYYGNSFMTANGRLYSYVINSATSERVLSHDTTISSPAFASTTVAVPAGITSYTQYNDGTVCAFAPPPPVPFQISGTVFEDVNYGGGAGRGIFTAGAVGRDGATVEVYDGAGNFKQTTTTAGGGKYSFTFTVPDTYQVRVVNSTVSSSRPGTTSGLLPVPVQTYRTNAAGATTTAVVDRVGGETPSKMDALANTGSQTLVAVAGTDTAVQSLAQITGITNVAGASNIDFGFNFDTIVNTNDSGQGSLRQFIINSNTLTNSGLAQAGLTPGTETSIFMISDGTVRPGLQSRPNLLTGVVAKILVKTALPAIADSDTIIDGATQTTNVGNTNAAILGSGATVGLNGDSISKVNGPEIEIRPDSSIPNGTIVTGLSIFSNTGTVSNTTITNIAIDGFGTSASNGSQSGNILVGGANQVVNTLITQNLIGTGATSFSDLGADRGLGSGIVLAGSATINRTTIQKNLIGYNAYGGIVSAGSSTSALTNLSIANNEIIYNGQSLVNTYLAGIDLSRASIGAWSGVVIEKNLIANNIEQGLQLSHATNVTVQNNTISDNGTGGSSTDHDGISVGASTNSLVFSNTIVNNKGAGAAVVTEGGVNSTGIKITQNEFGGNTNNAIDLGSNGVSTNSDSCTASNSGGANGNLARPVITSTAVGVSNMTLSGTYCNTGTYDIEFYKAGATGAANGSTNDDYGTDNKPAGEGLFYLGKLSGVTGGTFTDQVIATSAQLGGSDTITAIAINTTTNNTSEFSENAGFTPAKVLFVKRITAINGVSINTYANDTSAAYGTDDDDPKWPAGYLKGDIARIDVKPGDTVEYTIYFLNAGGSNANDVKICDVLRPNQTFLPAGTNSHDLEMKIGTGAIQILSAASDGDRGQMLAANEPLPGSCNFSISNINGTAIVDITGTSAPNLPTLLNAKVAGTANSYGFIRFTTKVNQ
jgi:parallel beta-helix repeat protein